MNSPVNSLDILKAALKGANTMEDFLIICSDHYDFKSARLGFISKTTLINNIGTVIALSGAKPKK